MLSIWANLSICVAYFGISLHAQAQTRSQVTGDNFAKQAQTLFVRGDIGSTTFDSQAAGSKDTNSSMSYEIGGWFGESRVVGLKVKNQNDVVDFSLNQSQSKTNFTDVRLAGRIWGIVPSLGVSLSEVDIEQADVATIGLFGTGVNAGLGGTGTLYPGIVLNGDYMVSRALNIFDKLALDTKLGDRTEADVHIDFDVTDRILDLIVGYRVRSYEIETPTVTYAEKAQGVYAGVRLGVYF